MPHREAGKRLHGRDQSHLGEAGRTRLGGVDITTAPQYSELGGAKNKCPHFADAETKAHRGQVTSEHMARKRQSQNYAF